MGNDFLHYSQQKVFVEQCKYMAAACSTVVEGKCFWGYAQQQELL